jgi:hypothetical protein
MSEEQARAVPDVEVHKAKARQGVSAVAAISIHGLLLLLLLPFAVHWRLRAAAQVHLVLR